MKKKTEEDLSRGRIQADSMTAGTTASHSQPIRNAQSERLPRVQIVNRGHPHFEEYGRFTGKVIQMLWGTKMAEIKLEHCRHGGDACFVSVGDVRQVGER